MFSLTTYKIKRYNKKVEKKEKDVASYFQIRKKEMKGNHPMSDTSLSPPRSVKTKLFHGLFTLSCACCGGESFHLTKT